MNNTNGPDPCVSTTNATQEKSRGFIACADLFALGLLSTLHLAFFRNHYLGKYTFPWDFLGGYHAHAYGWFQYGSVFSAAEWFPWSSMGFPAALAIQSGSWYLPLALLDTFDISYTIHVATIVQCMHVLFGSVCAYVLARTFGLAQAAAFAAAVCFQLSAGFYSNQQHVDIIRAYAWLPWILVCLQPHVLAKARLYPCLAALALFQFLVSAYPGNIVSTAYACIAFCVISFSGLPNLTLRRGYVVSLVVMLVGGVALAMLKWLPFAVNLPLLDMSGPSHSPYASMPQFLLTLVFPYVDSQLLYSDITMRGLYLPIAVLAGAFFVRGQAYYARIGIVLAFMGFMFGGVVYSLMPGQIPLPGLNLSRFPLTDWRAIVHLGLILMAVEGWLELYKGALARPDFLVRLAAFATALLCLAWSAKITGFAALEVRVVLVKAVAACVLAALCFSLARLKWGVPARKYAAYALFGVLVAGIVADGWQYHRVNTATWEVEWDTQTELRTFGVVINGTQENSKQLQQVRRPQRFLIQDDQGLVLPYHHHSLHNQCWYLPSFCVLGYDNIRLSRPHNTLFEQLDKGLESERLLAFLKAPQQLLLQPAPNSSGAATKVGSSLEAAFNIHAFPHSNNEYITLTADASARMLKYAPSEVSYSVVAPVPLTVIENEMWWEGWEVSICDAENCLEPVPAQHTPEYLRSWTVPAGNWTVTLRFHAKGVAVAQAVFLLALGGLLLYGLFPWGARRFRRK